MARFSPPEVATEYTCELMVVKKDPSTIDCAQCAAELGLAPTRAATHRTTPLPAR
jgi:hypothetical protein